MKIIGLLLYGTVFLFLLIGCSKRDESLSCITYKVVGCSINPIRLLYLIVIPPDWYRSRPQIGIGLKQYACQVIYRLRWLLFQVLTGNYIAVI